MIRGAEGGGSNLGLALGSKKFSTHVDVARRHETDETCYSKFFISSNINCYNARSHALSEFVLVGRWQCTRKSQYAAAYHVDQAGLCVRFDPVKIVEVVRRAESRRFQSRFAKGEMQSHLENQMHIRQRG